MVTTGTPRGLKVDFTTRPFVLSHGREPSRTVFGSWAFEFEDSTDPWFAPSSTLPLAMHAARAEAQRRAGPTGISTLVKILP